MLMKLEAHQHLASPYRVDERSGSAKPKPPARTHGRESMLAEFNWVLVATAYCQLSS